MDKDQELTSKVDAACRRTEEARLRSMGVARKIIAHAEARVGNGKPNGKPNGARTPEAPVRPEDAVAAPAAGQGTLPA